MRARTLKLTIGALGGQGGGVLSDWLIEIAESCGYLVQSTSVPGVAQRTGATIYYLEFFPRADAERLGHEPVMALMPVPGDVDCVVASELAEAGRAIQRGLITQDTVLIASTHRYYAISEKSAMGQGVADTQALLDLVSSQGKRSILFDMNETAERNHAVISAVMLGAISGAGVLPFPKESFVEAITRAGLAVKTNLAAFEDAYTQAERGGSKSAGKSTPAMPEVPARAGTGSLQRLLDRIRALPPSAQGLALLGARRALDYQDPAYADLYVQRLERVATEDRTTPHNLTQEVARALALWMTFEDTMRVAQLKTRAARVPRVRAEVRAAPKQILQISEFMRPRVQEIAGTMPAAIGKRVLRSPRLSRWVERYTAGKRVRTTSIGGFLLLYCLGGLRRFRRGTLRYQEENARIEAWLERIRSLSKSHYALALEFARAQRLIKGYGETSERGWRNFTALAAQLDRLAASPDGAAQLAKLQEAALADEEGQTLAGALGAIAAAQREAMPVSAV
jgi:indolepyruvate ferredoxin oxidoreductase, beta subunit